MAFNIGILGKLEYTVFQNVEYSKMFKLQTKKQMRKRSQNVRHTFVFFFL